MKSKTAINLSLAHLLIGLTSFPQFAYANPCDGGTKVQLHALPPGIGGTGSPIDPGVGGTGRSIDPGLGGTGRSVEPGVGGTGSALKTVDGESFVYGVITGFASICVNGVEIEYDAKTPVTSNGETSSTQALKVGQWVTVKATGQGREVNASSISIEQPIGGPVTRVDAGTKTIEVMGQAVRLAQGPGVRQLPKVGDSVVVSGFQLPNGSIQSSRIDPLPSNATAFVRGSADTKGRVMNVPVESSVSLNNGPVKVQGQWDGARLKVSKIQPISQSVKLKPGTRFHVQALITADGTTRQIGGQEIQGLRPATADLKEAAGRVAVVRGQIDTNGRANIESIESTSIDKIMDRGGRRDRSEDDQEKLSKLAEKEAEDISREVERQAEDRLEQAEEQLEQQERIQRKALDNENREQKVRVEKTERRERSNRVEKIERPAKAERSDRLERPDKIDKPERPEKPEKPEKAERPEKIERPERRD